MARLRRVDWAIILLMDTPFVIWDARVNIGVSWRMIAQVWWDTTRAMWRYGA